MQTTFLRCSFFMQNLITTHRGEIQERDEIFIPVGKAKTAFIDAHDIGAVAAVALREDDHAGRNYDLTGSERLDHWETANIMSEVPGRKITYRNPNPLHLPCLSRIVQVRPDTLHCQVKRAAFVNNKPSCVPANHPALFHLYSTSSIGVSGSRS